MMKKTLIIALFALFSSTEIASASTWMLDKAHTNIGFKVKHKMITNVNGSFDRFDGKLEYNPDDVTRSSVQVTIETASINTDNEKRDNHLRSADFFDAEKFPSITFKSKKIAKTADGLKISGDLTIHGITREVVLDVTDLNGPVKGMMGESRLGAAAVTKIDRRDFGLTWSRTLETGGLVVDNIVKIILEVEFVQQ
jgi:polyisoprenoid-binding protein YceI